MEESWITDLKFLISLLINLFIIVKILKRGKIYKIKNLYILYFLFATILVHSLWFSFDPSYSFFYSIKAIYVLISLTLIISYLSLELILNKLVLIIKLFAIIIIISSYFLIITQNSSGFRGVYFQGILANPNQLALYLSVLLIPFYIYELFIKKVTSRFSILILFNLLVLLFLSGSRTGIIVVLITFFYVFVKFSKQKFVKGLFLILCIGTFIFLFTDELTKVIIKDNRKGDFNLLSSREMLLNNRLKGIQEKPILGWGYHINEFTFVDEYHDFPLFEKGNTYLALWEEFGLIFGSIIIIFFLYILFVSFKIASDYYFLCLIILAALIHSNGETWIFIMHGNSAILFWSVVLITLKTNTYKNSFQLLKP